MAQPHRKNAPAYCGFAIAVCVLVQTTPLARAEAPPQSSRLFAMPIADVVGAYQLTLSGDGSLLQKPGVLTSAGVLAIGFGDIAQLEYRHTAAISIDNVDAPVPALGVQLKLPVRDRAWVPAMAAAVRLGVPREQTVSGIVGVERVTDLYAVGRIRPDGWLSPLRIHAGVRVSLAQVALSGAATASTKRTLVLPAIGVELLANDRARVLGELAWVPQFLWQPESGDQPVIDHGLLGRFGMRWRVIPAFSVDASVGLQLEAGTADAPGPSEAIQWDIRLGGEVFVSWGGLLCRAAGVFCRR